MSAGDDANPVPLDARVRADQWEAIEEIVARTGATRDDVVRRALDLGLAALRHDDAKKRPPSATQ